MDDIELRLQLATEVGVFHVGIDCLKALKDKERLRNYINCIPANKQWDYRRKIDDLLANSVSAVDAAAFLLPHCACMREAGVE